MKNTTPLERIPEPCPDNRNRPPSVRFWNKFSVIGGNAGPGEPGIGTRMTMRIALVAATFSLVVCALLLYDFERRAMKDPFEAKAMLALKVALKEQPGSEVLKEEIRAMDERLREEYFRQKAFAAVGAALLAAGVVVFLIAVKSAAVLRRRLPMPQPFSAPQDFDSQWTPVARWAVAAMVVLLAAVSIVLSLGLRSPLPEEAVETAASQSPVATDPGGSGSSQAVTPAAAKPPVTPAAKPTVTVGGEAVARAFRAGRRCGLGGRDPQRLASIPRRRWLGHFAFHRCAR